MRPMTERELEEYRALRGTIRQRGSVRICVFVGGLAGWGLAALATGLVNVPLITLIPLVVLAGTFEAVFALHAGAERVGRYLQVFYGDLWEQTAMAFGRPLAGTGSDPLFVAVFGLAAVCNFMQVLLAEPVRIELAVIGGGHALFGLRLITARRAAARQRAADLERFQKLRNETVAARS
jgi:hypothetical protein